MSLKLQTVRCHSAKRYDVNFINQSNLTRTDNYYNISKEMITKLKVKLGLIPIQINEHKVEL